MKKMLQQGFTLVELLIVMAIIAIMAVGVLVGLNPLEQIKRANDSTSQQMSGQLLDAVTRYYSTFNAYPWGATSSDNTNLYRTNHSLAGVTLADGTSNGKLVPGELKTAFKTAANDSTKNTGIFVGKFTTADGKFHACFVPKSAVAQNGAAVGAKYNSYDYMVLTGCADAAADGFSCTAGRAILAADIAAGGACISGGTGWAVDAATTCALCITSQ